MNEPSPGTVLRQALTERGWTQTELAQRTGFSKSAISRIISDRTRINVKFDYSLSLVLGTPQGYWLQLTDCWIAKLRRYPVAS